MHNICMMCHPRHPSLDQLRHIEQFLYRVGEINPDPVEDRQLVQAFLMGTSHKCRYGMPCSKLGAEERQFRLLAPKVADMISSYLKGGDPYPLLERTRGFFPVAYKRIEEIARKNREKK